jgi:hypothetical protein
VYEKREEGGREGKRRREMRKGQEGDEKMDEMGVRHARGKR